MGYTKLPYVGTNPVIEQIDMNGYDIITDADGNSRIECGTDNEMGVYLDGALDITFAANTLQLESGTILRGASSTKIDLSNNGVLKFTNDFGTSGARLTATGNGQVTLQDGSGMGSGTLTVADSGLVIGTETPFQNTGGSLQLQNIDAIDATTEATFAAAFSGDDITRGVVTGTMFRGAAATQIDPTVNGAVTFKNSAATAGARLTASADGNVILYNIAGSSQGTLTTTGFYSGNTGFVAQPVTATTAPAITVTQSSTGDAAYTAVLSGGTSYTFGIDNSDSDKFKVSYGAAGSAALGTGDLLQVTTVGDTTITGNLTVSGGTATVTTVTATNLEGTLSTAAQASVTSLGTLTQLNCDNLRLDGNAFTSTNSNGNITVTPNGTGFVVADRPVSVGSGTAANTTSGPSINGSTSASVANNGTYEIATNAFNGIITVVDTNGAGAVYALRGGVNATTELSDVAGTYTVTSANAGTTNIFWNAGTSRYRLENKSGGSVTYAIYGVGHGTASVLL